MTAQDPRVQVLRFSVFELDLERRELRRRGVVVPLPPQAFTVLTTEPLGRQRDGLEP